MNSIKNTFDPRDKIHAMWCHFDGTVTTFSNPIHGGETDSTAPDIIGMQGLLTLQALDQSTGVEESEIKLIVTLHNTTPPESFSILLSYNTGSFKWKIRSGRKGKQADVNVEIGPKNP